MPITRCKVNRKTGWKYGASGKCYTGPNAEKKAAKQAVAIGRGVFPKESEHKPRSR